MKKIVIAAAIATLSTTAFAQHYVQGDVGYSKLELKIDNIKAKDNATSYTIAAGKDMGNIRYQVDYTNFGNFENRGEEKGSLAVVGSGMNAVGSSAWINTAKAQSLGASVIYDFQTVSGLTPYAGVRVGVNQLNYENTSSLAINNPPTGIAVTSNSVSGKQIKVGAGALAGVQYAINPQLVLDVGVEYNHLGKFKNNILDKTAFNQYGAKVGVRYNF